MYKRMVWKELNSSYKSTNNNALVNINSKHLDIISRLGLLDRAQPYSPKSSHFLLKNHKQYFLSNPSIRLICPAKSDLSRISKHIIH